MGTRRYAGPSEDAVHSNTQFTPNSPPQGLPGIQEMMDLTGHTRPTYGCICPPGANLTCQAPLCPRSNRPLVVT